MWCNSSERQPVSFCNSNIILEVIIINNFLYGYRNTGNVFNDLFLWKWNLSLKVEHTFKLSAYKFLISIQTFVLFFSLSHAFEKALFWESNGNFDEFTRFEVSWIQKPHFRCWSLRVCASVISITSKQIIAESPNLVF